MRSKQVCHLPRISLQNVLQITNDYFFIILFHSMVIESGLESQNPLMTIDNYEQYNL